MSEMAVTGVDESWKDEPSAWIGVKHRALGSRSIYFGPFSTFREFEAFCDRHRMGLVAIELVDPNSDDVMSSWWH
jgi:hypothetical protein